MMSMMRQHPRPAADDRQHDDAERGLQLCVLVEVVEDDLRHFAALQLEHDAHAVAIGLVAQVRYPLDDLFPHQLGDVLEQSLLVDLVGNLGDDNRDLVAFLRFLGRRLGAQGDRAAPGGVGVEDAVTPDDEAAGRKVRPGDGLEDGLEARLARLAAMLDEGDDAVDDLPHVVRRDVGRHADGDAGRPVDEQVRVGRRQNRRFLGRLVEVGDEVDGFLVEIPHHLFGQGLETSFGVPVGRRRVAVDRAEVPLAVDQEIPHVEVLRQAHERVVGRLVTVRMVVADDLADDLRALAVGAIGRQSHLAHRVEHAAVRRLQAITNVRQRPPDDHAHGVIHVRALHLVFDVDGELVQGDVGHSESTGLVAQARGLQEGFSARRATGIECSS